MLRFLVNFSLALFCLVGVVAALAAYLLLSTPDPSDIKGCITAKMFNVSLCPKDASYAPIKTISANIKNAVIVSEDSTFYSHSGLDLYELRKSIDADLKEGRIVRGGSTITQQLAKNVYLSGEKSIFRKIREALIAIRLEKDLTKDQILEKYLNVVEFGPDIYGVKAACKYYFGKAPSEVSVLEGAWLAFLLPNPKKYSQSFRKKQLTKFASSQLKTIIIREAKFGKTPQADADEALAQLETMFQPYSDPNEQLTPEEQEAIAETPSGFSPATPAAHSSEPVLDEEIAKPQATPEPDFVEPEATTTEPQAEPPPSEDTPAPPQEN